MPVHDHRSRGRAIEATDQVQQRRLAAPRSAPDREELSGVNREVDAPEGMHDVVPSRIVAGEGGDPDDRLVPDGRPGGPDLGTGHRGVSSRGAGSSGQTPTWSSSNRKPDTVAEFERLDMGPGELQPTGAIEDGELLGDNPVLALLILLGSTERLGARPPVADRDGPIDLLRDVGIVGDHHDRRAELGIDPAQQAEHLARCHAVQFTGRLVGEEHGGPVRERDRDRDALLLATRQAFRTMTGTIGEADRIEQFERLLASIRAPRRG